jgi:hypothetical protein
MKYTIVDFNSILFNGFDLTLSDETVKIISELAKQVGSPDYVKTPVFKKRENPLKQVQTIVSTSIKKKKGKNTEITEDDWNVIRTFQATKFEKKEGIDAQIALIKSHLNKLSDKNYKEIKDKLIEIIEKIIIENKTQEKEPEEEDNNKTEEEKLEQEKLEQETKQMNEENMYNISLVIFEIASNNRFYSKIYANLYADLFVRYEFIKNIFENSFNKFLELFLTIEYVNPEENYDKFCKINKDNEKRKSLCEFFINLMINNIISKDKIYNLLVSLLSQVSELIVMSNKKNEVDEIMETIALLYKTDLFDCDNSNNESLVNGLTITEFITKLANSKVQKNMSLTSKTIFKCMDMLDL